MSGKKKVCCALFYIKAKRNEFIPYPLSCSDNLINTFLKVFLVIHRRSTDLKCNAVHNI